MDRRIFLKGSSIILGGLMANAGHKKADYKSMKEKRIAGVLKPGDRVALIAPGSSIPEDKIQKAKDNLESVGLNVVEGRFIREKYGYIAGKDHERIADIHWAFGDDTVDAIWCIRGGYGCTRLIPHLDYKLIKKNPKVLIGYSDITALHMAIYEKTGLTTFHGPVGSSEFTDFTRSYIQKVLFTSLAGQEIKHHDPAQVEVFTPGKVEGKLIGGNLSLISAMCGTKYLPSAKGKIVLLEDIDEKPYRIDRMLVQLEQAWDLKKAKGILLGEFADCDSDSDRSLTLQETLENHFKDCAIPVMYKIPLGHIDDQATYPIGIKVEMDTAQKTIRIKEDWLKK